MKTKRSGGLFGSRSYITWLVYGLGALLVMLMQTAPRFFPTVLYARPTPLILFVVCVGLFGGARIGALIGLLGGLLWDIYAFRLFGFDALVLMLIGLAAGLLVEWLLRANFITAMLLCGGAVLTHALLDWLFCHVIFLEEQLFSLFFKQYIPNAIYSMVLAPLMYYAVLLLARFVRRRTNR